MPITQYKHSYSVDKVNLSIKYSSSVLIVLCLSKVLINWCFTEKHCNIKVEQEQSSEMWNLKRVECVTKILLVSDCMQKRSDGVVFDLRIFSTRNCKVNKIKRSILDGFIFLFILNNCAPELSKNIKSWNCRFYRISWIQTLRQDTGILYVHAWCYII